jgi:hypothetical protein
MPTTHWTLRPLSLGRTTCELAPAPQGGPPRLCLEVYDGGGYAPSHGVWRIAGRVVLVVEAGTS